MNIPVLSTLHEATRRSEVTRHTSVGPENHVILVGVISTLEKVEEDVPCFYVYISCVRPLLMFVVKVLSCELQNYALDYFMAK